MIKTLFVASRKKVKKKVAKRKVKKKTVIKKKKAIIKKKVIVIRKILRILKWYCWHFKSSNMKVKYENLHNLRKNEFRICQRYD